MILRLLPYTSLAKDENLFVNTINDKLIFINSIAKIKMTSTVVEIKLPISFWHMTVMCILKFINTFHHTLDSDIIFRNELSL